jgi:hypothetical protein
VSFDPYLPVYCIDMYIRAHLTLAKIWICFQQIFSIPPRGFFRSFRNGNTDCRLEHGIWTNFRKRHRHQDGRIKSRPLCHGQHPTAHCFLSLTNGLPRSYQCSSFHGAAYWPDVADSAVAGLVRVSPVLAIEECRPARDIRDCSRDRGRHVGCA